MVQYAAMAQLIYTQRLSLQLREECDAEWNHELLGEHGGGTTLSVQHVRLRLAEQRIQAGIPGPASSMTQTSALQGNAANLRKCQQHSDTRPRCVSIDLAFHQVTDARCSETGQTPRLNRLPGLHPQCFAAESAQCSQESAARTAARYRDGRSIDLQGYQ